MENTNDPIDLAFGLESDENEKTIYIEENTVIRILNICFEYLEKHGNGSNMLKDVNIPISIGKVTRFIYYPADKDDSEERMQINAAIEGTKGYTYDFKKSKKVGANKVSNIIKHAGYSHQFSVTDTNIGKIVLTAEYWKE